MYNSNIKGPFVRLDWRVVSTSYRIHCSTIEELISLLQYCRDEPRKRETINTEGTIWFLLLLLIFILVQSISVLYFCVGDEMPAETGTDLFLARINFLYKPWASENPFCPLLCSSCCMPAWIIVWRCVGTVDWADEPGNQQPQSLPGVDLIVRTPIIIGLRLYICDLRRTLPVGSFKNTVR
jgi:hypothetical protein